MLVSPESIASRYGAETFGLRWVQVAGGFSGATVWRGEEANGRPRFALKAWPADGMTPARLAQIHGWMRLAAHLPFVPAVLAAVDGSTVVFEAGRVWEG